MSKEINIFIHIALLDGWFEKVHKYISLINSSGLFNIVNNIYLCFVGEGTIDMSNFSDNIRNKICIKRVSNNLTDFELPTQKLLYDFCSNNKDSYILYIHTKGVGKDINLCIEDWIDYMLYFLIEKYTDVFEYLLTKSTVGVDLRTEPTLHYSGNFWWAKSSYIATLPDPLVFNNLVKYPNPLNSERHNQEFWICFIKGLDIHHSMWDCGINCYQRHLYRYMSDNYR
jgi:hypothetical protein